MPADFKISLHKSVSIVIPSLSEVNELQPFSIPVNKGNKNKKLINIF